MSSSNPRSKPLDPGSSGSSQNCIKVAALVLSLATANAGTFTTDFSADPGGTGLVNKSDLMIQLEDGVLKLVDLADLNDENGVFVPSRLPLQSAYIFPEIDAGKLVGSFSVSFKALVGGGTERGAQG